MNIYHGELNKLGSSVVTNNDIVFIDGPHDIPTIKTLGKTYGVPYWESQPSNQVKFMSTGVAEIGNGIISFEKDQYGHKSIRLNGVDYTDDLTNLKFKGYYNEDETYEQQDVVQYDGSLYVAIGSSIVVGSKVTPDKDPSNWDVMYNGKTWHGDYEYPWLGSKPDYPHGGLVLHSKNIYVRNNVTLGSGIPSQNQYNPTTGVYWDRLFKCPSDNEVLSYSGVVNELPSVGTTLSYNENDVVKLTTDSILYRCSNVTKESNEYRYQWDPMSIQTQLAVEVTYNELYQLKTNSQLVPGRMYRITDYQCVSPEGANGTFITNNDHDSGISPAITWQSACHKFDIIVTALSNNTLSHDARACQHGVLNDYFAMCDLSKWELKYDIENDDIKYNWVAKIEDEEGNSTVVSQGIIYYMKDENNNECPYDFKNIKFKLSNYPRLELLKSLYSSDQKQWAQYKNDYHYTFTAVVGTKMGDFYTYSIKDASVYKGDNVGSSNFIPLVTNNVIKEELVVFRKNNLYATNVYTRFLLNMNIFVLSPEATGTPGISITKNTIECGCKYIFMGGNCCNNYIRQDCSDVILYMRSSNNTFNDCETILLGEQCSFNKLNNCKQIQAVECTYNDWEYVQCTNQMGECAYMNRCVHTTIMHTISEYGYGMTHVYKFVFNGKVIYTPEPDTPTSGSDIPSIGSGVL